MAYYYSPYLKKSYYEITMSERNRLMEADMKRGEKYEENRVKKQKKEQEKARKAMLKAQAAKKKACLAKEKEKEKARVAKEKEKELIAKEKEKEKARIAKEKEKERVAKEKERLVVQREREKAAAKKTKEREALAKAKEKERIAKEKERIAKAKEKERIAKEKARIAKEKEKERIAKEKARIAKEKERERVAKEKERIAKEKVLIAKERERIEKEKEKIEAEIERLKREKDEIRLEQEKRQSERLNNETSKIHLEKEFVQITNSKADECNNGLPNEIQSNGNQNNESDEKKRIDGIQQEIIIDNHTESPVVEIEATAVTIEDNHDTKNENEYSVESIDDICYEVDGQEDFETTIDIVKEKAITQFNILFKDHESINDSSYQIMDSTESEEKIDDLLPLSSFQITKDSLAYKYGLNPKAYEKNRIEEMNLSVRSHNALKRARISSIGQLILLSKESLLSIRNCGRNSVEEICNCISKLKPIEIDYAIEDEDQPKYNNYIIDNKDKVLNGDFSFFDNAPIKESTSIKSLYEEAFQLVGKDLINDCINQPNMILPILMMLKETAKTAVLVEKNKQEVEKTIDALGYRKSNHVRPYLEIYPADHTFVSFALEKVNSNTTFNGIASLLCDKTEYHNNLMRFLKWCDFKLDEIIDELFVNLYAKESHQLVIHCRQNMTLEETGKRLNVTRERVRQIEAKCKLRFDRWNQKNHILLRIAADLDGATTIPCDDLRSTLGINANELLWLLKDSKVDFIYNKNSDTFIRGTSKMNNWIECYLSFLPEIFNKECLQVVADKGAEFGVAPEAMEKAILNEYHLSGRVYHKHKLRLGQIYEIVMKKYYPDGMNIYDSDEIEKFRQHIFFEFGDIKLPKDDRPISAAIPRFAILCGKGRYKVRNGQVISTELVDKIENYIEKSERTIFLMNTLFAEFEDDLIAEGINNKYYLQGSLRDRLAEKYVFSRDYISKDANVTSIYYEIDNYLRNCKYPVGRDQLQHKFTGVPDYVIGFALSGDNIINLFGKYLHVENIRIDDGEIDYLQSVLDDVLSDYASHHASELMSKIMKENAQILSRNGVDSQFATYSILEHYFSNDYQFSRPYLAMNGVEIGHPSEQLIEYVSESENCSISDIFDYAKEVKFTVYSRLDFLKSLNDTFFIQNKDYIVSIEKLGLSKDIVDRTLGIISNHVEDTVEIRNLSCISDLPPINTKWTDWIIYSLVNKWSDTLEVDVSSNKFSEAVPLISKKGKMDTAPFIDVTDDGKKGMFAVDNINDIDSLIEELICDDIIGDNDDL